MCVRRCEKKETGRDGIKTLDGMSRKRRERANSRSATFSHSRDEAAGLAALATSELSYLKRTMGKLKD